MEHKISSPIGTIKITGNYTHIERIEFIEEKPHKGLSVVPLLNKCAKQLKEYFSGTRKTFDLPIAFQGTEFQIKIWKALIKQPYGHLISYEGLAMKTSKRKLAHAIGYANKKNKILIIVPCHRVIGKNGKLMGYSGGLWRKQWLIEHETNYSLAL